MSHINEARGDSYQECRRGQQACIFKTIKRVLSQRNILEDSWIEKSTYYLYRSDKVHV